jgi:hypothetical protein
MEMTRNQAARAKRELNRIIKNAKKNNAWHAVRAASLPLRQIHAPAKVIQEQ